MEHRATCPGPTRPACGQERCPSLRRVATIIPLHRQAADTPATLAAAHPAVRMAAGVRVRAAVEAGAATSAPVVVGEAMSAQVGEAGAVDIPVVAEEAITDPLS